MIPALVQWEVTDRCPFNCIHCYHYGLKGIASSSKELSDAEIWKVAKIIVANRLLFVTITGGEPLLRIKLLIDVVNYLHDNGIVVSLNTSLATFNLKYLMELKVARMLISCTSSDEDNYRLTTGNGNYRTFEHRLKTLLDADKSLTINMVVNKYNKSFIRSTATRMAELGIRRFAATPASVNASNPKLDLLLTADDVRTLIDDLIWIHEELDLRVDILESIPKCLMPEKAFALNLPFTSRSCHAGKRNGTIGTQGDVRPCSHNPRVYGNILVEDIAEIWKRMYDWRENSGNYHSDCLSCDMFNQCGGGCRIDAAIRCGTPDARHPYMPNTLPELKIATKIVQLKPTTKIKPVESFQQRPENGGWLVAPGSPRNIIHVGNATHKFLVDSRNLKQMTLSEFAEKFGTTFDDKAFQDAIAKLTLKQFFILQN